MVAVVIGSLGGGMAEVEREVRKVDKDGYRIEEVCRQMLKVVLCESEMIIRKVNSGVMQQD